MSADFSQAGCLAIAEINPGLDAVERETLAVFVSSAVAGSTMFIGFEKSWAQHLPLFLRARRHDRDTPAAPVKNNLSQRGFHRGSVAMLSIQPPERNATLTVITG